jgi:hypothetical protein
MLYLFCLIRLECSTSRTIKLCMLIESPMGGEVQKNHGLWDERNESDSSKAEHCWQNEAQVVDVKIFDGRRYSKLYLLECMRGNLLLTDTDYNFCSLLSTDSSRYLETEFSRSWCETFAWNCLLNMHHTELSSSQFWFAVHVFDVLSVFCFIPHTYTAAWIASCFQSLTLSSLMWFCVITVGVFLQYKGEEVACWNQPHFIQLCRDKEKSLDRSLPSWAILAPCLRKPVQKKYRWLW